MFGEIFCAGCWAANRSVFDDFNAELRQWVSEVANQRVHGTTHEQVLLRWDEDQFSHAAGERTTGLSRTWTTSSAR